MTMDTESVVLTPFSPSRLPALVDFLNRVLVGHRHWAPITQADFTERVLAQPGFDPGGVILALADGQVVGGAHAIKPLQCAPVYAAAEPRHHIAWLAVDPAFRRENVGSQLLAAAEDYLYYCPVYFAAQNAPFYGIVEKLWVPWYGSTERMGVSAAKDVDLIAWLGRRGYSVVDAGDVSMAASLHDLERPHAPDLEGRGLTIVPISQLAPWTGDEPLIRLRAWGDNGCHEYGGLVVADGRRAVGSAVWYPLPDGETAALAWIGLERPYRGLRFGSYLLDRALVEMAGRGYLAVEVHVHSKSNPEAYSLFRRRAFQVIDYWVNLVRT
jgi:ribosomal protein S18 acetylase RimI-like enzyme